MSKNSIEQLIQINQRGLTLRNLVTPEKTFRSQQREYLRQYKINNTKEKKQKFMDKTILNQLANVETIRFADDKVDTYETQVTRKISELMSTQDIKMGDGR